MSLPSLQYRSLDQWPSISSLQFLCGERVTSGLDSVHPVFGGNTYLKQRNIKVTWLCVHIHTDTLIFTSLRKNNVFSVSGTGSRVRPSPLLDQCMLPKFPCHPLFYFDEILTGNTRTNKLFFNNRQLYCAEASLSRCTSTVMLWHWHILSSFRNFVHGQWLTDTTVPS